MLPAGVVMRVDKDQRKGLRQPDEDQIKNAPEFDDNMITNEGYRGRLGSLLRARRQGYNN